MDENPWSYRIMAEELINEDRYEQPADPESVIISDVRNYLYIEYSGSSTDRILLWRSLQISLIAVTFMFTIIIILNLAMAMEVESIEPV